MSEEAYAPIFYYSKTCPHSMTLLEILASYQNTFPSMKTWTSSKLRPMSLARQPSAWITTFTTETRHST